MIFKSAKEKIKYLFKTITSEDQVLILIVPNPDSISSAWVLKRILWRKVKTITNCHWSLSSLLTIILIKLLLKFKWA
ncbi:MAG: hypothetical protein DRP41_05965 [Thermodesulfobacteriota bacterium]|nr:MAG: hypothetical protein DRP41_05965 [Thermodesulfobacteriota bacterium]